MRDRHGRFKKGHQGSRATQFKPGAGWHGRKRQLYWDRDWLYTEYIIKQRSAGEIATEFNCKKNNIHHFLHKHGIKIRTTSEARAVKYWGSSGEENGMFGVGGANHPSWKGGITPERQAVYSSLEWGDAVKVVWARDKSTCQRCGKEFAGKSRSFHVHHIISFYDSKDFRTNPDNLVLLCLQCHRWIHSKANIDNQLLKEVVPNGDAGKC